MTEKMSKYLFLSIILALTGCGGGGGSDDPVSQIIDGVGDVIDDITDSIDQTPGDDQSESEVNNPITEVEGSIDTGDEVALVAEQVEFNFSDAVALIANSDVVSQIVETANVGTGGAKSLAADRATQSTGKQLSRYVKYNQRATLEDGDEEATGGTNLLKLLEDGSTALAIDSELPIRVLYTATSPDGDKVYVVLDNGWGWWSDWDGNDYTQYIAHENCAIFVVSLSNNTFECAAEGIFVQGINDDFMRTVSGNQKPLQFDADGNVYFMGTPFEREEQAECQTFEDHFNGGDDNFNGGFEDCPDCNEQGEHEGDNTDKFFENSPEVMAALEACGEDDIACQVEAALQCPECVEELFTEMPELLAELTAECPECVAMIEEADIPLPDVAADGSSTLRLALNEGENAAGEPNDPNPGPGSETGNGEGGFSHFQDHCGGYYISQHGWESPRIYKYSPAADDSEDAAEEDSSANEEETTNQDDTTEDTGSTVQADLAGGTVEALTPNNQFIEFFLVLPSGEVVFQAFSETGATLTLIQGTDVFQLTGNTGWGVDFFTVDDHGTVIFGQESWHGEGNNGLRFVRPLSTGGIEKALLDTTLFGKSNGSWGAPSPHKIITADNGRIYGVFSGGRDLVNSETGEFEGWTQTLTVYQLLPYNPVPRLEIDMGEGRDWWSWMGRTPFQIAGGYLYYSEEVELANGSTADIIKMMNLDTREVTILLSPANGAPRYSLYNWRLSGGVLFFSALNQSENVVVTGEINTSAVQAATTSDEFLAALTVNEAAEATDAIDDVQDIEVIREVAVAENDGVGPTVLQAHQDMDNLYSMSVDFSKAVDKDSVEANLTLTNTSTPADNTLENGSIPFMKVWIANTLHVIPDTDSFVANEIGELIGGLNNNTTSPLDAGESYSLSFATSGVTDTFGNAMTFDTLGPDFPITMRPDNGFYIGNLTSTIAEALGDTEVLRYAGPSSFGSLEAYDMGTVPANVRVEFSARNLSWEGPTIVLWDQEHYDNPEVFSDEWQSTIVKFRLGGWTDVEWKAPDVHCPECPGTGMGMWDNANTPELFNGQWKRYRLDIYGTNIVISHSADGVNYTEIEDLTQSDLNTRSGGDYRLLLRVREAIEFDNLQISTLNSDGSLATTAGDVVDHDFDDEANDDLPSAYQTNVKDSLGLHDW